MMTKEQMTQLLSDLTSGYGIRQILAILLIFLIGVFFLYGIREKIKTQWLLALAYPVGLALWCVAGFLLLTLGIRFCLFSELAIVYLITGLEISTALWFLISTETRALPAASFGSFKVTATFLLN